MKIIKSAVLSLVILPLFLAACFTGWQENEALIILNLGVSTANRTVWAHKYDSVPEDSNFLSNIEYRVKISGQEDAVLPTGEKTYKTTVTPGIYNIDVEAMYLNEGKRIPYAKFSVKNKTIKSGSNDVKAELEEWNYPGKTYLIAKGVKMEFDSVLVIDDVNNVFQDGFSLAFNKAKNTNENNGLNLTDFTISVDGEHFINNDSGGNIGDNINVTIKSHDGGEATLKYECEMTSFLFNVSSGSLTLQGNITLEGVSGSNNSAVIVVSESGILNMRGNVTINNNNDSEYGGKGGGVYVADGGIFNMYNGVISENKASSYGGGVYVEAGGIFNMYNGIISGNKACSRGGGVFVEGIGYEECCPAKFIMKGGTITDNHAGESGGGVYVDGDNGSSGIFCKKEGTVINGNYVGDDECNVYLSAYNQ
jgi:hypothetical protein